VLSFILSIQLFHVLIFAAAFSKEPPRRRKTKGVAQFFLHSLILLALGVIIKKARIDGRARHQLRPTARKLSGFAYLRAE
jgi:hypothetical protein